MKEDEIRNSINSVIKDEIQDMINDYVDAEELTKKSGLGFVSSEEEKELKISVSQREIDRIIKELDKPESDAVIYAEFADFMLKDLLAKYTLIDKEGNKVN